MAEHAHQEVAVRRDPVHAQALEHAGQARRRFVARRRVDDDLRQQGIELRGHLAAWFDARVQARGRVGGRLPDDELSGRGQEVARRVLRVKPDLDGVARAPDVVLLPAEALALRDADLLAHEVEPREGLGHGMLDLQSRVHLEEVEAPLGIDDELDGPRAHVAERAARRHRRRAHALAHLAGEPRRRRLLDELLVPPLDRALPLEGVQEVAVGVAQDLHLDVAAALETGLEEERVVTEGAGRLTPRPGHRVGKLTLAPDHAHTLAAAAGRGLDEQRVAEPLGLAREVGRAEPRDGHARQRRHARRGHEALGGELVAHGGDRRRRRPDPGQPGRLHGARERRVLGEKAVPRVHGVGARPRGGSHRLSGSA